MRRRLLTILTCLVAGVLTSVVVAWGIALRGYRDAQAHPDAHWVLMSIPDNPDELLAARLIKDSPGVLVLALVREPRETLLETNFKLRRVPVRTFHSPADGFNRRSEFQFGWPAGCLWGGVDSTSNSCFTTAIGSTNLLPLNSRTSALTEFPFHREWRAGKLYVPTGILWTGMAADTAFYASLWWLMLLAPRRIRAATRRRRGQCIKCGYDLAGIRAGRVCPECGATRTA